MRGRKGRKGGGERGGEKGEGGEGKGEEKRKKKPLSHHHQRSKFGRNFEGLFVSIFVWGARQPIERNDKNKNKLINQKIEKHKLFPFFKKKSSISHNNFPSSPPNLLSPPPPSPSPQFPPPPPPNLFFIKKLHIPHSRSTQHSSPNSNQKIFHFWRQFSFVISTCGAVAELKENWAYETGNEPGA